MKRSLLLFGSAIVGLLAVGVLDVGPLGFGPLGAAHLGPSSAVAAGGFTLDPAGTDGQIETLDKAARFSGTLVPEETSSIFAYIDGKLLTCEEYFGNEINSTGSNGCWRIATIDGTDWTFSLGRDEVERLGITFLAAHDVQFVLTHSTGSGLDRAVVAELSIDIEFVDILPTPTPTPEPEPIPAPPASEFPLGPPPASALATGDPASPSVLSALRPVTEVVSSPTNLLVTAAVTIVLLLLVGLPSALLGQTLSENYERLFGRVAVAARRAKGVLSFPDLPRWLPLAFGIAVATIMSAFVDPGFGWNLGSARMLVSVGIAFAIESVAGWWVIRTVLRKTDPDLDPKPEFKFGSLVIILVAVILSRIVGFEPGMVFGLVVGLAFGVSLATARDARVKLIGLGWALAIGLVGWLGYSLLAGVPGWLPVFTAETLSAIAVSSLAALPVALLPLAGLDGGVLFHWNRRVWAGVYALALFLFFFVLMPMPFSWGEVGTPLATWVGLYAGYALLAGGLWALFRFAKSKAAPVEKADAVQRE